MTHIFLSQFQRWKRQQSRSERVTTLNEQSKWVEYNHEKTTFCNRFQKLNQLPVCRPGYIVLQEVVSGQSERWRVCGLRKSLCIDKRNQREHERKNQLRYNCQLVSLGVQQSLYKHRVPPLTKQAETRRVRITVVVAKCAIATVRCSEGTHAC